MDKIKVISFDADDTLWVNETYFQETRHKYATLLSKFTSAELVEKKLEETEHHDIPYYGYGIKPFTLSMIEAATHIAGNNLTSDIISEIIKLGKDMLSHQVEVLDGIEKVLQTLNGKYKLVVATKGDLLDQKRKLQKSGLMQYFNHVEIMSDKKPEDYLKILEKLDCPAENFLMIGNSLRSDILPVLELGGKAIHIPFSVTWEHEMVEGDVVHPNLKKVDNIAQIIPLLGI